MTTVAETSEPQIPTRAAGVKQLHTLSEVITRYATSRNYADSEATSQLSAYLRRRLVLEEEVLSFARSVGSFSRVEKFAQEVVWRTYWKGWLETHPTVWQAYLKQLETLGDTLATSERERLACAIAGTTDLPYFNAWCHELTSTGYLHNHLRMWFASVWVFTLQLPWELGAQFFLDNLLDGDPASNTLSWRWVAGLQTPGKHYLARGDNIVKYTNGRWAPKPGELNETARPLPDDGFSRAPAVMFAPGPDAYDVQPRAVLLHDEDCGLLPDAWVRVPTVRYAVATRLHHCPSPLVDAWVAGACADANSRMGAVALATNAEQLSEWCRANGVVELWGLRPLTGFVSAAMADLSVALEANDVKLRYADRGHDLAFFRLATKGFFPFRNAAAGILRKQWT